MTKEKELLEVKERIISSENLTNIEKQTLLQEIENGKEYDFETGYATIDRPWLKFFKMDEYYKLSNDKTVFEDILVSNKDYMDELALMYFGGKITYEQMFSNIDKVAKSLEEYGVKKGDFVTVCSAGTPELVYIFYALAKIGAIANLMAPNFEPKQMSDRINDCESKTLIVMDSFYPQIKDTISKSNIKNTIVFPALNSSPLRYIPKKKFKLNYVNEVWWKQFIKDGSKTPLPETFKYEKDYPLCTVYSSGTTGFSKAIVLSHDSFQNSVLSYDANTLDIERGQKMYQVIPPWYSTGLNASIHLPIHRGVTVFMDPRFERDIFVKNIIKHDIDFTISTTSLYEGFLDEKLTKGKTIKTFAYPFEGGEPLSSEVKTKIENSLKKMGCNSTLRSGYGQCECGAQVTSQTNNIDHPEGSVGIPIPGVSIAIFDDDFNELKYNQRGNILVSTPCGMLEYYNKPEETSKYFYTDDFGRKWSCTGDIGYLGVDGDLFIEGRKSDCSISNGKIIYNFDIENALTDEEGIKMYDCVSMDNDLEGDFALHIIFEEEQKNEYKENIEKLFQKLHKIQMKIYEKYKDIDMVPTYFKIRDEFPVKPFGKRDIDAMKKETDGFIEVDKAYIIENNPKLIKRI